MATASWRLSDYFRFRVVYDDQTKFGSMVSGQIDAAIRARCAEILDIRQRKGLGRVVASSIELLDRAMSGALSDLHERPGVLREECLYPEVDSVSPRALAVIDADGKVQSVVGLEPETVPCLAQWMGNWQRGRSPPDSGPARRLWSALVDSRALTREPAPEAIAGDVLFAGHATVRIANAGAAILFDPFLVPVGKSHPPGYRPVVPGQLAPAAIFITHSHPDHFDPGSLLRFGAEIPIYVPYVARESLMAIDMGARLKQLGFEQVRVLRWYEQVAFGTGRVVALPFHGEQATTFAALHPEVHNYGNLYYVETSTARFALTADGGVDGAGSVAAVAADAVARLGPVDAVFGGYRSWALYPIRYLFSSVSRYLLFVPRNQWLVRQKIMNDADDALDTCERWQARHLLPYADGGAPWYWDLGLGPRLDVLDGADEHFDPRPEHVRTVASRRSSAKEGFIPSPVNVHVPRPGDVLSINTDRVQVQRIAGHAWPYGDTPQ
jgi:L-ascorbate metabolism protein UlaG (beta-lactamase superfamily)